MQKFGEVFQKFRKARGLKLKDLATAGLSISQLSRFEHGKTELTVTKFMQTLDELNVSLAEFMYVAHEFQQTSSAKLFAKLDKMVVTQDVEGLKRLLVTLQADNITKPKFSCLNITLVKLKLQKLTGKKYYSKKEIAQLNEYLFSVDYWGQYEILLFMNSLEILPHNTFMLLAREMVRRSDFYQEIPENRHLLTVMLLKGYLICIEQQEFIDALYFEKKLEQCFFTETELYERLIFHYAKNLYQYEKSGEKKAILEMRKCIGVMRLVASDHLATAYEQQLERVLATKNCR